MAEERSRGRVTLYADRRTRAHSALDRLGAMGLGHGRFGAGHVAAASLRLCHGPQRTYPSGTAEGRRQRCPSHRHVARVPAAHTGSGRHRRAGSGHGAGRAARQTAWNAQAQRSAWASATRAGRHATRSLVSRYHTRTGAIMDHLTPPQRVRSPLARMSAVALVCGAFLIPSSMSSFAASSGPTLDIAKFAFTPKEITVAPG